MVSFLAWELTHTLHKLNKQTRDDSDGLMPKLPCVSPKQMIKVLEKIGFVADRQHGSHLVLINNKKN